MQNNHSIELIWRPPVTFRQLFTDDQIRSELSHPGVYFHTDHREGRVAYVGKASGHPDLWRRNYTHFLNLIGGLSLIPTLDSDSYAYDWLPNPKEENPNKEEYFSTLLDQGRFTEIIGKAYRYSEMIMLHFCPLKSQEDAKLVERELLFALEPLDTDRGTKSPPDTPTNIINYCGNLRNFRSLMRRERSNILCVDSLPSTNL